MLIILLRLFKLMDAFKWNIFIYKEKGVSEVIATILLIAIAVVLVAVLSLYMSGMLTALTSGNPSTQSLSMNVIPSVSNNQITYIVSSGSVPSPFFVNLLDQNGKNVITNSGVTLSTQVVTVSGGGVSIKIMDVNKDGKLDAGDVLILTSTNSISSYNGYTLQIVYNNAVVYSSVIQV
jgi:flagellin-like protein